MPRIPRIIHQTWKTMEIPYEIYDRRWVESWTRLHPDWLYVLWSDQRLRELGRACYPGYEALYKEDVPGIYLADFGRYMVLHYFGGLYVDLDYECLKNIEPLLAGHEFVTSYADETGQELNNALLASVPEHPLTLRYMAACCTRWTEIMGRQPIPENPEPFTGPAMMTEITNDFLAVRGGRIKVYEARLLCPFDWRKGLSIHRKALTPEVIARVREDYPDAYAATYWTHIREAQELDPANTEIAPEQLPAGPDSRSVEELAKLQLEIQARDETIGLLRDQSKRQQEVIDAQRGALREAQHQISDMERSLSWRVVAFVRASAKRFRGNEVGR
jgi:Glycosyltransferase sugar-binding region containing DXD motif